MATKNNRRTIITKKILRESLLELMEEKDISKVTIKEICNLSDMSRSTFYLHYQDQYALLEDIENEVLEKTFENLGGLDSKLDTIESIEIFLNYVKDNKKTFGILLCQEENKSFQQAIIRNVEEYVRDKTEGKEKETEAPRTQFLFTFVMNGTLSIIVDWINSDFKMSANDMAELIYLACDKVIKL